MSVSENLAAIFEADRRSREAEAKLFGEGDPRELSDVFASAVEEAFALDDDDESELRLRRLADLCAQVPGPKMADALITILDHHEPAVRTEAGEALLDVAYQRFKDVAQAIERALDRKAGGPAMQELPFILTEIRDPDPLPLLSRFLKHEQAEIVAATIEALAAFGDPLAIDLLEPLVEDTREATIEDLEDDAPTRIGDLAKEAIEELED
jgi:HEAT repeat protein